jgi:glycerol-1-phosphatase
MPQTDDASWETVATRPVVCCDLDGVVWRAAEPITGAAEGIALLRSAGSRVAFLSNNSAVPIADVVAKLGRCGIQADPDDVLTSATAAARLLAGSLPAGASVLTCGGPGVVEALEAAGFALVDDGPCDAVVVGLTRTFDYDQLDRVARTVRDGARFIATNVDATYPVAGGFQPGAGAIVAAVAVAAGRQPEIAGKPEAPTVALVRERLGGLGVVVGDRPSTDGALANALGWPFGLVLSGVASASPGPSQEAIPDPPPSFVAADLGALAPVLVARWAHA